MAETTAHVTAPQHATPTATEPLPDYGQTIGNNGTGSQTTDGDQAGTSTQTADNPTETGVEGPAIIPPRVLPQVVNANHPTDTGADGGTPQGPTVQRVSGEEGEPSTAADTPDPNSPEAVAQAQKRADADASAVPMGTPTAEQQPAVDKVKQNVDDAMKNVNVDDLEAGKSVTLTASEQAYLQRLNEKLAGSTDAVDRLRESNPELAKSLANSQFLISSSQMTYTGADGKEHKGSGDALPPGIRQALESKSITEKTHGSLLGRSERFLPKPGTMRDFRCENYDEMKKLSKFYALSEPKFRNGSDISRNMIARAGEYAWAQGQMQSDSNAMLRKKSAPLTRNGDPYYKEIKDDDGIHRGNVKDVINELLSVAGEDNHATTDALAGKNMPTEYDHGLLKNLLTVEWQGQDKSSGQNPDPNFGLNKVLMQLNQQSDRPNTQEAVKNLTGLLAKNDDFEGYGKKNPGVLAAISTGLMPYQAEFGGFDRYPGIPPMRLSTGETGGDDDRPSYTQLLKVLYSDPDAAVITTSAISTQQSLLAQMYGRGEVNSAVAVQIGQMQNAMQIALQKNFQDESDRDRFNASLEFAKKSAQWDTGANIGLAVVGLVPGGSLVGTIAKTAKTAYPMANPLLKYSQLGVAKTVKSDGTEQAEITMNAANDRDPYTDIRASIVQGLGEKNAQVFDDPRIRDWVQVRDGKKVLVPPSDERSQGGVQKVLKQVMAQHGIGTFDPRGTASSGFEDEYQHGLNSSTLIILHSDDAREPEGPI